MSSSPFMRYLWVLPAYGFVRRIPYLRNAEVEEYNRKEHKFEARPMLVTEKFAACVCGAVFSYGLTPFWLCNDLTYLEVKLRGLDAEKHGFETGPKGAYKYFFE